MAVQRIPPMAIATQMGCPVETVYSAISKARRAGTKIGDFPRARAKRPAERNGKTVVVPVDILDRLKPHADTRGMTVNRLIRLLLDEITDGDLVDAVLDDAP